MKMNKKNTKYLRELQADLANVEHSLINERYYEALNKLNKIINKIEKDIDKTISIGVIDSDKCALHMNVTKSKKWGRGDRIKNG